MSGVNSTPGGINTNYLSQSFLDNSKQVKGDYKGAAVALTSAVNTKLAKLPPTAKAEFLALVKADSVDLAPTTSANPNYQVTIDKLGAAATSLTSLPPMLADAAELLATVMVQEANAQRKNALQDRMTARQQAKSEMMAQAGKLTDEANTMESGATASLISSCVGGALSIAGGAMSLGATMSSISRLSRLQGKTEKFNAQLEKGGELSPTQLVQKNTKLTQLGQEEKKIGEIATKWNKGGDIIAAGGRISDSVGNYESVHSQSQGKIDESQGMVDSAIAQDEQQTSDQAKEVQQGLDDFVKNVIQFLKELADAKAQLMQAATRA